MNKAFVVACCLVWGLLTPAIAQNEGEPEGSKPPAEVQSQPLQPSIKPLDLNLTPKGEVLPKNSVQRGVGELSALQALLEFFFMEAGIYPPTIEELDLAYNTELPQGARAVPIPKDPVSGKDFVYRPSPDRKGYYLSFPDPTRYGLPADFEMRPVTWGWLALRAERNRFEEMAKLSKYHLETLATQVELYAKDHGGVYPENLDDLYPKYIKRHPQDPISGKNYSYAQTEDGYIIVNPNPERYGLEVFQYSSTLGIEVEVLPPEK